MQSNEQLLEVAASGGAFDSESWPRVREFILKRIDELTELEFPPPPAALVRANQAALSTQTSLQPNTSQSSTTTSLDKENAPPLIDNSVPIDAFGQPKQTRSPLEVAESLQADIRHSLNNGFQDSPPHTIQRVAELVLHPKKEYRYLTPYLQALSRTLSVTSNTSAFPLPYYTSSTATGATSLLVNGHQDTSLGSDESLGGALLTPIPWLTAHSPASDTERELHDTAHRLQEQQALVSEQLTPSAEGNEMDHALESQTNGVEGESMSPEANLDARLRSEGAVSQGELLRLEQQAGVTPIPTRPQAEDDILPLDSADGPISGNEAAEEIPHARGPEEIGVEDTGLQTGTGGVAGIVRSAETTQVAPQNKPSGGPSLTETESTSMDVDTSMEDKSLEEI